MSGKKTIIPYNIYELLLKQEAKINELRARIAELEAARQWHPASEPPEHDGRVLLEFVLNRRRAFTSANYERRGETGACHYHWYDYERAGKYIPDGTAVQWRELPAATEGESK